jgi:hypothetical protein
MPNTPSASGRLGVTPMSITGSSSPPRPHKRFRRRVGWEVDDPLVGVGEAELTLGQQHAIRGFAADGARFEVDPGAWDVGAGRCEDAFHSAPCIRGAADDLDGRACPRIDHADTQAVGIWVLPRRNHVGDHEGPELLRRIGQLLQLQPDSGQRLGISSAEASVSRYSLSQERVNFICFSCRQAVARL